MEPAPVLICTTGTGTGQAKGTGSSTNLYYNQGNRTGPGTRPVYYFVLQQREPQRSREPAPVLICTENKREPIHGREPGAPSPFWYSNGNRNTASSRVQYNLMLVQREPEILNPSTNLCDSECGLGDVP